MSRTLNTTGDVMGICSIIAGSLSILGCCWIIIAVPLALLGILLSISSIAASPDRPWLGFTGLALSLLGAVLPFVAIILFVYADSP